MFILSDEALTKCRRFQLNPEFLYKYRAIDSKNADKLKRIEGIFANNELYFAAPSEFNDPFDCKILPVLRLTKETFRKYYLEGAIKYPEFSAYPISLHEKFVEHLIDEGMHQNEAEFKKTLGVILEKNLAGIGICCFSSKNDDILMWSHYANGHTGFCLEFDVKAGAEFFNRAIKVDYSESYPLIDYFDDKKWLQTILLTKSHQWAYEDEWRILKYNGPEIEKFPEQALSSVIFGCQMTKNDKRIIFEWIEQREKPIQIKEARIKEYKFGLEIVTL
jgi:hypothetical protein